MTLWQIKAENLVANLSLEVSTLAISIPGVLIVTAVFCSRKNQSDGNYTQNKIILRKLNTLWVLEDINWSEVKTIEWLIFGDKREDFRAVY